MGKNKKSIIYTIVSCLIIVAMLATVTACGGNTAAEEDDGAVEPITRENIVTSIAATGVVDSTDMEDVVSGTVGTKVTKLYVKEGETVSPGQVVAQLDTTALQQQYAEIQKSIADAKADKIKSNQDIDKALSESQRERDEEINELRQEVSNAQAETFFTAAELDKQRNKYAQYLQDPEHSEWDEEAIEMESNISNLEISLQISQYKARAYQEALDESLNVEDNGESVDELRAGLNDASDSTINALQDAAKELQRSISEATVRTTIGGVVTSLPVKVGDIYLGGTICTVENVGSMLVDAEVSEYDVADIAPGMKVRIKTDATRNQELSGVVTFVAPRANSTTSANNSALAGLVGGAGAGSTMTNAMGSSAMYRVKVSLDEQNPRLRLGMNAKLSIITSEATNTLAVPYEAVQEEEDGRKYVELVTNMEKVEDDYSIPYEKEKVYVDQGVVGTYYIEVHGTGIKEGAYVYIPADMGSGSVDEIMKRLGANTGV